MKNLEKLLYEVSPFIYVVFGFFTIVYASKADSYTGIISGVLLLTAGATIVGMRHNHRTNKK
jgi:hypothetical protein